MGNPVKQIVISGYYGFRNSGDEAVLQSILLALEAEGKAAGIIIEPIVLSIDPSLTTQMYGVRSVHRMKPRQVWNAIRKSDGLISGGGSLLQDATGWKTIPYYLGVLKLAQLLRKPTFIYSQGIGPVNRSLFFSPIVSIFTRCEYVSVRDKESANLLSRMGYTKNVEVVPDPVMGLPLRDSGVKEPNIHPIIGISVRYWNKDHSELRGIVESLKQVFMHRKDAVLRFLPFHQPSDEQASQEIIDTLKSSVNASSLELVQGVEHPQDMLKEVASCDLLIGMRLHSLIYAASQYIPMVAISYDPKIDQFMRRLDARAASSAQSYDVNEVANDAIRLLEASPEWHSARKMRIEALKKEAQRPAQQIVAWLRQ